MSRIHTVLFAAIAFSSFAVHAQTELPRGYKKGQVILSDGITLDGFVKNNIGNDASVYFIGDEKAKKKEYNGTVIAGVNIGDEHYICSRGDFFKVIANGELLFLQKASNASGKITYNGNEPILTAGTDGKPGDYFISDSTCKKLTPINKHNLMDVAKQFFHDSPDAIEKAKNAGDDIAKFSEAVVLYNSNKKK